MEAQKSGMPYFSCQSLLLSPIIPVLNDVFHFCYHNSPLNPGPVQGAFTVRLTSVSFHVILNPL